MAAIPSDRNYHLPVFFVIGEDPLEAVTQVEEVLVLGNPALEHSGLNFHHRSDIHF